jgi:hypothetical protein
VISCPTINVPKGVILVFRVDELSHEGVVGKVARGKGLGASRRGNHGSEASRRDSTLIGMIPSIVAVNGSLIKHATNLTARTWTIWVRRSGVGGGCRKGGIGKKRRI